MVNYVVALQFGENIAYLKQHLKTDSYSITFVNNAADAQIFPSKDSAEKKLNEIYCSVFCTPLCEKQLLVMEAPLVSESSPTVSESETEDNVGVQNAESIIANDTGDITIPTIEVPNVDVDVDVDVDII